MSELFQERFRELPAFQKMLEQVKYCLENDLSDEEFATRMMLMADSPISWFTTCGNCSALMDKNYSQYMEIERLKNKYEPEPTCGCPPEKHHGGYCHLDM
jgi:hypothetical protein